MQRIEEIGIRQGCYEGDLDEVRLALALRADVKDPNTGRTALMCAVEKGHDSIVRLLLGQLGVNENDHT